MPSDRRSEEEIRREIADERDELARALADMREGIESKRRIVSLVAAAIAVGLTAVAAVRLAQRVKGH